MSWRLSNLVGVWVRVMAGTGPGVGQRTGRRSLVAGTVPLAGTVLADVGFCRGGGCSGPGGIDVVQADVFCATAPRISRRSVPTAGACA